MLLTLYSVGVICTVGLMVLSARDATTKRVLACFLILAAWVALLATRDAVDQWRTTRQVTAIFSQFEVAANQLRNH